MYTELEEELKERLHIGKLDRKSSSSGCISKGQSYSTDDGTLIFVKVSGSVNSQVMFEGEKESLSAILATNTIRAPKPKMVLPNYNNSGKSAIVMEYLDMKPLTDTDCSKKLGLKLAALHDYNNKVIRFNEKAAKWIGHKPPSAKPVIENKNDLHKQRADDDDCGSKNCSEDEEENPFAKHRIKYKGSHEISKPEGTPQGPQSDRFVPEPNTEQVEKFGFHVQTSCGSIPQVNHWTDDWVSFFARHRIDKSIRSLLSDHGDRELMEAWTHLQLKIDKFFTDFEPKGEGKIVPALLHGDLWSGNVGQLSDNSDCVIYDPCAFYGHNEYDFGIARMFSGFSNEFEKSYFEVMQKMKYFERRSKLYQLFHHLNHWDHFGSGYRSSSLSILKELNSTVSRI